MENYDFLVLGAGGTSVADGCTVAHSAYEYITKNKVFLYKLKFVW